MSKSKRDVALEVIKQITEVSVDHTDKRIVETFESIGKRFNGARLNVLRDLPFEVWQIATAAFLTGIISGYTARLLEESEELLESLERDAQNREYREGELTAETENESAD